MGWDWSGGLKGEGGGIMGEGGMGGEGSAIVGEGMDGMGIIYIYI